MQTHVAKVWFWQLKWMQMDSLFPSNVKKVHVVMEDSASNTVALKRVNAQSANHLDYRLFAINSPMNTVAPFLTQIPTFSN